MLTEKYFKKNVGRKKFALSRTIFVEKKYKNG
jgi:hypothetical protein